LRSLWETQPGMDRDRSAAETDHALSTLADAGVSRLSLSTLGRILSW
jgi:hypothetical protein